MASRRVALVVIALGLGVAGVAQVAAPLAAPPLYDGVVVVEPYVYVNPPPGKPGGAKGASARVPMNGTKNAVVALATPEQPPQAQVVAGDGTLILPSSASALDVAITPLDPSVDASVPGAAQVLGNVYRITIADQAGAAATALISSLVTVVVRAPGDVAGAQVGEVVDGTWHPLRSEPMFGSTYVAVVTSFGDFAVIVPGATPAGGSASGAQPGGPASTPGGVANPAGTPVAASGEPGSDGSSGSGGSVSGQLVGAVIFLLLLLLIGAGTIVKVVRGRTPRR